MGKMKKALTAFAIGISVLLGAQEYTSPRYTVKIFDRYLKDSGLNRVILDKKRIINRNILFCWVKNGDKNERLAERLTPEYKFSDNILSSNKKLVDKNGKEFAEITRTMQFKPDSIQVEVTAKALTNWTIPNTWSGYREILLLPTDQMIGTTIEVIRKKDGTKSMAVIPKVFDRKLWSLDGRGCENIKMIFEQYAVTVTASEGTTMNFGHYGGNKIELAVLPIFKPYELEMKAGTTRQWNYTLTFEKLQ